MTQCKYKRIGCPWQGPFHELPAHESECSHPTKTGTELMGILGEMDQSHRRDMQLYNSIFSLLCYEKIGFTGRYKKSLPCTRKTTAVMLSLLLYWLTLSSSLLCPLMCPTRGAVQAVPHWWLHHSSVLWNAALHCSQPDVGAEGSCERLWAQPQPVLQAHPLLPAHPQKQGTRGALSFQGLFLKVLSMCLCRGPMMRHSLNRSGSTEKLKAQC